MKLSDILFDKGRIVLTISPSASLDDVVQKLVEHNCGSLVVCEGANMVGIITERDILRACAARRAPLEKLTVGDHMTPEPITAEFTDEVSRVMGLMTKHRIRHMPIVEDGRLAGIVSIGDLVKAQHDQLTVENHYLKTYIQG
jgi:CBS domain-containing protein